MSTPVVLHSKALFRTEVVAGPHRWVLDEPVDAGGGGEGPTPYDMLAAALGGCTAMTLHFYARREKLPLEGVTLTVTHDRQRQGLLRLLHAERVDPSLQSRDQAGRTAG
jgi:uncharacterized OsmC-like protein